MNAKDIRNLKVLTDELLKDLINQVHPLIIKKVGDGNLKILQITDMTGLRTSHYLESDLVTNDNQKLIDDLPEDEIINDEFITISYFSNEESASVPEAKVVEMTDGVYTITSEDIPELTLDGYEFTGWYIGDILVEVGDEFTENVKLEGKFIEVQPEPPVPTHEFVDLGLSVQFATQVISDDKGNPLYFQWGDIVGYTESQVGTDKVFDWSHYKFGTDQNLTKYNDSDKLTTLESEDDAATQLWGSDWRMPTQAELEELWALPSEWVENYRDSGLNGRVFAGNGNTLFIPALGFANNSSVSDLGTNSSSWSSSLDSGGIANAVRLDFSSGKGGVNSSGRCEGYCVLPVQNLQ